ncbi:MAG: hypothetical protein KAS73_13430, partial [Candidatus Sabulitectum sp.]|nr:hypothetical protein [Candidatus Sabulitectum sp.]
MFSAILFTVAVLGFGPWECLGPEGGAVYAPVQSPSDTQKIWALSDSDPAFVYYSSDAGATWA